MINLLDILSYADFTGFEFAAVCAMTRGGRGGVWRLVALGVLIAADIVVERFWNFGNMPLDRWLAFCFAGKWLVSSALIFALSRDRLGRRLFLSITYGAYAIGFAVIFHLLAYRNVLGLSVGLRAVTGLGSVALLNLLFLFWILPRMPRDVRVTDWRDPFVPATVMFVALYTSGVWPVSAVTAPLRYCMPFLITSVAAWMAFPVFCRSIRERLQALEVQHSLEQMMAEVEVRRSALDKARRIRHDQRHHRIALGGLLLQGKTREALEYLNALDEESDVLSAATRVWCENETINAVLAGASRKAAAKGVAFSAEARVGKKVPLPDIEVVAVLANLIENALNACGSGSAVTVTLRQRGDRLGLTVANPVPSGFRLSPAGLPCPEPGIGLGSVRRVVDRHTGDWQYTVKDGLLTCELVICSEEAGR